MSFQKITEETSLYNDLENKSVTEILNDINSEDQKVTMIPLSCAQNSLTTVCISQKRDMRYGHNC